MKFLAVLFIAILCANASAQTIRTLGYNTTNGQVVYSGTNTLTLPTIINAEELANSGDVAIQLANRELLAAGGQAVFVWGSNYVEFGQPITFAGTNAAPASRANLGFSTNLNTLWTATNSSNARSAVGLELSALTNTSNVTAMRALSGSTNTNQPFSGQFNVIDDNSITFTIVVSNGIIVSATEY